MEERNVSVACGLKVKFCFVDVISKAAKSKLLSLNQRPPLPPQPPPRRLSEYKVLFSCQYQPAVHEFCLKDVYRTVLAMQLHVPSFEGVAIPQETLG